MAANFLVFVKLTANQIWLRVYESTAIVVIESEVRTEPAANPTNFRFGILMSVD